MRTLLLIAVLAMTPTVAAGPPCISDTNGDGTTDVVDLVTVILAWGTDDPVADVNLDGIVDVDGLIEIIIGWGPCLPPVGACCLPDGTCIETFEQECVDVLCGEFHGLGVFCFQVECEPFVPVVVEQIFADDAGSVLDPGLAVFRLYVPLPDPDDQLILVYGGPDAPFTITVTGGTFEDLLVYGFTDRPPSFGILGVPFYVCPGCDSWLTIGNSSLDVGPEWPSGATFTDHVSIGVGTGMENEPLHGSTVWNGGPGGPDNIAWAVSATEPDPGDGTMQPTPQSVAGNWPGNRVLIAQLVVEPDGDPSAVRLAGTVGLGVVIDGKQEVITGVVRHCE